MQIRTFLPQDRDAVLALVSDFYTSPACLHAIPVQNFADAFDEMAADRGLLRGPCPAGGRAAVRLLPARFHLLHRGRRPGRPFGRALSPPRLPRQGLRQALLDFLKKEYAGRAARLRLEVAPENPARAAAL